MEHFIIDSVRHNGNHKWKIILTPFLRFIFCQRNRIGPEFEQNIEAHTTQPLNASYMNRSIRHETNKFETLLPPGEIIHFLPPDDDSQQVLALRMNVMGT